MAIHFEAQEEQEVMQIRSRELQLDSVKKMEEEIVPVVENINDVNFNKIESDTNEIKDMVINNLDDQPDISELLETMKEVSKGISVMKGQITKVSNKVTELSNSVEELKE